MRAVSEYLEVKARGLGIRDCGVEKVHTEWPVGIPGRLRSSQCDLLRSG